MREQGIITEIIGDSVKIRLIKKPECAKCGLCANAGGGFQILTLKTQKSLQINQIVKIEINPKIMTLSSILLYGVPLSSFVCGAIIGYVIGKEILATVFAISLLTIDLFIVRFIIKKLRLPEKMAVITE